MHSCFLRVAKCVDSSVVRKVISALEDFQRYPTMSKADDLS